MFHRVARVDVPEGEADRLIDDAVRFFREKQYDCLFTLSPLDRPADMAERLRQRGFELALLPVAMLCDRLDGPVAAEDVEVEIAGAGCYDTWAEIMCACFGNPPRSRGGGDVRFSCVPEVRLYLASRHGRAGRHGAAVFAERHRLHRRRRHPSGNTAAAESPPLRSRAPSPTRRPWATAGPRSRSNARARRRGSTGASASAACISGRATPGPWRTFSEMPQGRLSPGSPESDAAPVLLLAGHHKGCAPGQLD